MLISFVFNFSFVLMALSSNIYAQTSLKELSLKNGTDVNKNGSYSYFTKDKSFQGNKTKKHGREKCEGNKCSAIYENHNKTTANLLNNTEYALENILNKGKNIVENLYQNKSSTIKYNKTEIRVSYEKQNEIPQQQNISYSQIINTSLDQIQINKNSTEFYSAIKEILSPKHNKRPDNLNETNGTESNFKRQLSEGKVEKLLPDKVSGEEKINENVISLHGENYEKTASKNAGLLNKMIKQHEYNSFQGSVVNFPGIHENAGSRPNPEINPASHGTAFHNITVLKPSMMKRTTSKEQSISQQIPSANDRLSLYNEGIKDSRNVEGDKDRSTETVLKGINQTDDQASTTTKTLFTLIPTELTSPHPHAPIKVEKEKVKIGEELPAGTLKPVNPTAVSVEVSETTATSLQQLWETTESVFDDISPRATYNFASDLVTPGWTGDDVEIVTTKRMQDKSSTTTPKSITKNYGVLKFVNETTKKPNLITDLKSHLESDINSVKPSSRAPYDSTEITVGQIMEIYNRVTTQEPSIASVNVTLNSSVSKVVTEMPWPVKKEAVVEGDLVVGGLMMVHEREDSITCGPVMPQGGIQALEAMLYTLDRLNYAPEPLLPNVTIGAHILDDCDKDTYGLEMAVDFIKESMV